MKFQISVIATLSLFAVNGFAAPNAKLPDAQTCPIINGHLADDVRINDIEIHSNQEGGIYSYAFGSAPLTYFVADGREVPAKSNGQTGTVKVECGPTFISATEKTAAGQESMLKITVRSETNFGVEGTGLYGQAGGNYQLVK